MYTVISGWKAFEVKNDMCNLGNVQKHEQRQKSIENSPPLYQIYTPTVISKT